MPNTEPYLWNDLTFDMPSNFADASVITLIERRDPVTQSLTVAMEESSLPLTKYVDEQQKELRSTATGYAEVSREEKKIAGKNALLLQVRMRTEDGSPAVQTQAYVQLEGRILVITGSSIIYDLVHGRELRQEVPEGAVVVPGSRPASGDYAKAHGLQLAAPCIVKYRDDKTDAATALEQALR